MSAGAGDCVNSGVANDPRKIVDAAATTTIRIQPVKPEADKPEDAAWKFFGAVGYPFLASWLLMLGLGAAHSLFPVVPAASYWTVFAIWFGLASLVGLVRRPSFKWARR